MRDMDEVIDYLKLNGTLTGSRAWGVNTLISDHDFFMLDRVYKKIMKQLKKFKVRIQYPHHSSWFSEEFKSRGVKFVHKGVTYDIWGLPLKEMQKLEEVNAFMVIACDMSPWLRNRITSRHNRIKTFEHLRSLTT